MILLEIWLVAQLGMLINYFTFARTQTRPKRLTLAHMRTLKMSDEVLCVKYSPDQNLVAVSLLDTTVKVFYHDTLKFFLSLYGHKVMYNIYNVYMENFHHRID